MAEYTNRVRVMAGVKSGLIILALYFQQIISFSGRCYDKECQSVK